MKRCVLLSLAGCVACNVDVILAWVVGCLACGELLCLTLIGRVRSLRCQCLDCRGDAWFGTGLLGVKS